MIKKIVKIINIGSFLSFDWDKINPKCQVDKNGNQIYKNGNPVLNDSSFSKYNIFYGENGSGKSTLVKIFKSLHTNNDSFLDKNWDKIDKEREISLELDSAKMNFGEQTKWQGHNLVTKFVIFDKDYINNYIHTGKDRTSQQDRNTGQLILYLGDFFTYKYQIDKLIQLYDNIKAKQENFSSNYETQIRHLLESIKNPELSIKYFKLINNFNTVKFEHIKIKLNTQKEKSEIKSRILNNRNSIINIKELFRKNNTSVDLNTEQVYNLFDFTVSQGIHITLKKIEGKETFIAQGTRIVNETKLTNCPYCEQVIIDTKGEYLNNIIEYKSIFNEVFLEAQKDVEDNLGLYKKNLQSIMHHQTPAGNDDLLSTFNNLLESNQKFNIFKLTENEIIIIEEEIINIDKKLLEILKPLNSLNIPKLKIIFSKYNKYIIDYNKKAEELNTIISSKKIELNDINISQKINGINNKINIIDTLSYTLLHFTDFANLSKFKSKVDRNLEGIKAIDDMIKLFRDKIDMEFTVFINNYLSIIKNYIKKLCPAFELFEIEKSRTTNYDFRSNDVFCGFNVKYKEKDRFKDLSEGEKQVIAIAYFLAMLEKENNKVDKIVVFDDPITSFDSGKRKQTVELILNNTNEFNQVFVITCDPLFKRYSQKIIPNQKSYYILKASSSSIFYTPKNVENIYNSFKKDLRGIDMAHGTDEDIVEYGQKLRFCIEEIRETYLGHHADNLSNVLNHINNIDLNTFKEKIPDLLYLYNYCNTGGLAHYPKDGSTSWVELKTQVNKYLSLSL